MKSKTMFSTVMLCVFSVVPSFAEDFCDIIGGTITNNITLNVPTDYATIQDALECLGDKSIHTQTVVTIKIADGTYNNYDPIVIDHPSGKQIEIIGNTSSHSSVTINFKNGNGIDVSEGSAIGKIDGLTLVGGGSGGVGINATYKSFVRCGPNLTISDFHTGIYAFGGAAVFCRDITSKDNDYDGIYANGTSYIDANGATAKDNARYGVAAFSISFIDFRSGSATGNTSANITSDTSSTIEQ